MSDLISRKDAIQTFIGWGLKEFGYHDLNRNERFIDAIEHLPSAEPIPCDSCIWEVCNYNKVDWDVGEVSDGYHTFNQLYHQRAVLFATIVNQNKDKAWKSWKHEDGKFCFDKGGEWFIVGVDTPEGSYTYHYEKKYWDLFDCEELDRGKHWDGHTEEDVTRLLSLPQVTPTERTGEWIKRYLDELCLIATYTCSECGGMELSEFKYCPNCGAIMVGDNDEK